MAETIYTGKGNVKSYKGSSGAYTFYLEVKLNSQNVDTNKSNVTVNHYAHGNNGWNYSLYSQPKSTIKIYNNNSQSTVTDEAKVSAIPDKTKTLINSWTGDITHKPDGTLDISITAEYKANVTNTADTYYMPNNSSLSSGTLKLPDLHTPPSVETITFAENNQVLTGAGVAADVLVPYLSNKTVTISANAFDGATISKYQLTDGATTYSNTSNSIPMDMSKGLAYSGTSAELTVKVTDSMGSVGSATVKKTVIPYSAPNLIATSSNVKRNGQTTGKVIMNLKGTFYNAAIGSLANSITLKFAYWKTGTAESTTYYTIPASAYTISGNNIIMTNWPVAANGTEISNVDKASGYQFKVQVTDVFGKTSVIQLNCTSGEYLMAKYKDRVDFKKITQKNKELWDIMHPVGSIFITSTNSNPSTIFGGTWTLIDKGFNPRKN